MDKNTLAGLGKEEKRISLLELNSYFTVDVQRISPRRQMILSNTNH